MIDTPPEPETKPATVVATGGKPAAGIRQRAWRILGTVCVTIGFINAFIPLMPTTVFLLIGAWAWSRGAPELHQRLLAHPRWGAPLRHWADGRRISRRGKRLASLGIGAGWLLSVWIVGTTATVLVIGAGLGALLVWLWMRPEPAS